MNKYDEFEDYMERKFPEYFGEGKHYGGFCVSEGWFQLVDQLCSTIRIYEIQNGRPPIVIDQIKEKLGGFRFYCTGAGPRIMDYIRQAEETANKTCEDCGKEGKRRSIEGWLATLCDEHYDKRNENRH